jgi:hypothetical protein
MASGWPRATISEIEHYVATEAWRREPTWVALRYNDPCAYCGGPADTWDHLDPVGGQQHNLTRACERCNVLKGRTPVLLFLACRHDHTERNAYGWHVDDPRRVQQERRIAKLNKELEREQKWEYHERLRREQAV